VPTGEITTKIEKTSFSRPWPRSLFLEWAQCCSISSTHLNPALHATSNIGSNRPHLYLTSVRYTRRSLITIIVITSVSRPGAWLSSRIASTYSGPGLASIVAVNRSMLGGLITIQRINWEECYFSPLYVEAIREDSHAPGRDTLVMMMIVIRLHRV